MNSEPETYEELIRKKRCIDLSKYYELSYDEFDQIYDFLCNTKNALVKASKSTIILTSKDKITPIIIQTKCLNDNIDGIIMSDKLFRIIPHYDPPERSSYHSSYSRGLFGGSSGGTSSNNNNNNNNR